MANSPLADTPDRSRQRTVRRLVVVLILIAVAIIALALLDRASKRVALLPEPAGKPALPITALPVPAPSTNVGPLPQGAPNPPASEPLPKEPPSPPAVLNNETLPPPTKQTGSHRKPESAAAEDTRPAKIPEQETGSGGKPGNAATPLAKTETRSSPATQKVFVLQLGVFSAPENAKALQDRLAKAGIQSYSETRVQVGPFKDKAEADKARATLNELGVKSVIVPQQ